MIKAKVKWLFALVLFLSSFCLVAPAQAAELTISSATRLEGLTFVTPFYLPNDSATNTEFLMDLQFGTPHTLFLSSKPLTTTLPELLASPIPSPTPTPSPDVEETPLPTSVPTPPPPSASPVSQGAPALSNGGLNADTLFAMVNAHRASINLPAFQKDDRSCSLAAARAPELAREFSTGTLHSGMYGRKLPYWNTENAILMNSEQAAFNWWMNDYIHRKAIDGDYKYSCIACSGNSCAEEFTNFQPK